MTIWLVGMMGSGKSTIGRLLASALQQEWIDMDFQIEQVAGKSIPEIFQEEGEPAFRKLEKSVALSISKSSAVISTGGGVVKSKENQNIMKENGLVIYLESSAEGLLKRLKGEMAHRPLLRGDNPQETLAQLLNERQPMYLSAAHLVVDVENRTPDQIVAEIMGKLE